MHLSLSLISTALLAATAFAAPASQAAAVSASAIASASASVIDYASIIASMMEATGSVASAVPMDYFINKQLEKRWSWDKEDDKEDSKEDTDDESDDESDDEYHGWDDEHHKHKHSEDEKDTRVYHVWHHEEHKKNKAGDMFDISGDISLFSSPLVQKQPVSPLVPRERVFSQASAQLQVADDFANSASAVLNLLVESPFDAFHPLPVSSTIP